MKKTQSPNHPLIIVAGPCAAENEQQILEIGKYFSDLKISSRQIKLIFRAGLWKPRTDPSTWQGVGTKGISWLLKMKRKYGLPIATEIKDIDSLHEALAAGFDYVWIGSRNGLNYPLIEAVGQATRKTTTNIIIKRAMSASLTEWIGATKYASQHNHNIILCERGIRGYSPDTRNILDLQTAYLAQKKTKLPVIVDVSHASGRRDLIIPMARAAVAAGLTGLMIEVHPTPSRAKTDHHQQISLPTFSKLITEISRLQLSTSSKSTTTIENK